VLEVRSKRLGGLGRKRGTSSAAALQWRAAEHGVLAREGNDGFYSLLGVVRRFLTDRLKPWQDMGSAWRGDMQGWWSNGVRSRNRPAGVRTARGIDQGVFLHSAQSLGHGARTNGCRPASACVYDGVQRRADVAGCDAARATSRALAFWLWNNSM
jgi:hypothetical protein